MACVVAFFLIRIICLMHVFSRCSGDSFDIDSSYGKDNDHRLAKYELEDDSTEEYSGRDGDSGGDDDDDCDDDCDDDDDDDYYYYYYYYYDHYYHDCICQAEIINGILWTPVFAGDAIERECFDENNCQVEQIRYCTNSVNCTWDPNNTSIGRLCPMGYNFSHELTQVAEMVGNRVVTNDTLRQLINLTSPAENNIDIFIIAELLDTIENLLDEEASVEFTNLYFILLDQLLYAEYFGEDNEEMMLNYFDEIYYSFEDFAFNHVYTDYEDDSIYFDYQIYDYDDDVSVNNDLFFSFGHLGSVALPPNTLSNCSSGRVVSNIFKNVTRLLNIGLNSTDDKFRNDSTYDLISPVISAALNCCDTQCRRALRRTGTNITISHTRPMMENETPICVFWNQTRRKRYRSFWSTRGCIATSYNTTHTVCTCNHLTNFAVLFDTSGTVRNTDSAHTQALMTITYVGTSLSLAALSLTIFFFIIIRSQWSLRTFVHINLCSTLFIAQLIFLIGADKTSNNVSCAIVAILLHYFFLASFMWMLMEGVFLYITLVKVFSQTNWKYYVGFTVFCYGGTLLYMALCIPLGLARATDWSYGNNEVCWLTYKDHFVWTFIAPVILIIMCNIVFLIMALRIMRKQQEHMGKERVWYWFRGSMSLIIIMGINWIFGVLSFNHYLLPLIYLFAITTALQGVWIFIFFVLLSPKIRMSIRQGTARTLSSYLSSRSNIGINDKALRHGSTSTENQL